MNATQFLDLIQKADQLDSVDFIQLNKIQENYPYFQIPYILEARYDFLKGAQKSKILGQAAITSPDRIWLKTWIERPLVETLQPKQIQELLSAKDINSAVETDTLKNLEAQQSDFGTNPKDSEIETPKRKKRPVHKDDLIETIRRKEKKTILDSKTKEQIDLIKAFSKKDIKLATIKEIEANQNTENLAEASTKLHDHLLSETFAKILTNQGKKGLAKEIYKKLILKFPEKTAYFADLIEKLKE